jgi:L-ascorbate metabolism protein UlaG (beta-lactamase superfamily)
MVVDGRTVKLLYNRISNNNNSGCYCQTPEEKLMKYTATSPIPIILAALALGCGVASTQAIAQGNVKITPLGSHDGEFCRYDRALILEDPDGTRLLYDAGRTVRGAEDPRLGQIDAVLLSHVHGDHLGDKYPPEANAGTCAEPDFSVAATPNSNSVDIVVGKKAKFLLGGEMPEFFTKKVEAAGGDPALVQLVRFGGTRKIGGATVASVPAVHSNGLSPAFIGGEIGNMLKESGLTAYVGPPGGYVVTFSNGLAVYLSGDTGITAEQDLVVRGHYGAKLVVLNIGGTFTTGPTEAAYVINELVKPNSVIASHANEEATKDGKLLPDTRTAAFKTAVTAPVHVPLSGVTMEFNSAGTCVAGCEG